MLGSASAWHCSTCPYPATGAGPLLTFSSVGEIFLPCLMLGSASAWHCSTCPYPATGEGPLLTFSSVGEIFLPCLMLGSASAWHCSTCPYPATGEGPLLTFSSVGKVSCHALCWDLPRLGTAPRGPPSMSQLIEPRPSSLKSTPGLCHRQRHENDEKWKIIGNITPIHQWPCL